MIWGNPEKLAIEAQLEPNALMPVVGANIAGRIRCYVGGEPFGNWDEPLCVLGAASDHLLNLAASPSGQWHPLLETLTPRQRFSALDDLIYESSISAHPGVMSVLFNTRFLTNISEAFDYTKSFILSDPDEQVQVLVDSPRGFFHAELSRSEFVSLAEGFSNWVKLQEHRLIGGGA
ncbi:MAG TPA: hypothetical protein VN017_02935 [Pseudoxanthomonas sp.]|nr:hypothetical protein [Pseudoxanthomonas sp.]